MRLEVEEERPEHREVISEHHTNSSGSHLPGGGHARSVLSRQLSGGHEALVSTARMLREDQWR